VQINVDGHYAINNRQRQYVFIFASGRHSANPNYVVAGCLDLGYRVAGYIFIGQKAHFTLRSDKPFPISERHEHRRAKPQGRRGEAWIIAQNIGLIPPIRPMMKSTARRVPRITGLPTKIVGSRTIRAGSVMDFSQPPT
jgi:hypothetical protein